MTLLDQLGPEGYRLHKRQLGRARTARYRRNQGGKADQPFIGVDGEGGGRDDEGRQHYLLLRSSGTHGDARELWRDNQPLPTRDCLEFILGLPKDAIAVWFFGTYDATQILRDLPPERIARLFQPTEPGRSPYTYWSGYAIDFRPRQYFRVARTYDDGRRMRVVPGSSRTVNEVGGFFQAAFLKVVKDWNVGTPHQHELIAASKEARDTFELLGQTERTYCLLECKLLARLMTRFRETCREAGTMPVAWRGAGHIAAALHRDHGTAKRSQIKRSLTMARHANAAYYGGRFEITTVGRVPGPIYEYDINSAYPAAMRHLPCPHHTRWRKLSRDADRTGLLYIARVHFRHAFGTPLCGLPIRHKGHLFWPREGEGTYWSPEIDAAIAAGASVEFLEGYYAETRCDCPGFGWVEQLYETRRQLGKSTRGYPLKLGINGLYGKLAQRLGGAPFRDLVAAGLITAYCRAQLIRAYALAPHEIVMMATDSIFSRVPLPLDIGPRLGQWELKERPTGLFVVQPGVYWSPGSETLPKTRGIPQSQIIKHRDHFEALWHAWANGDLADRPPTYPVAIRSFIGHRAALARGKPQMAGAWITAAREISFDWKNKRETAAELLDGCAVTSPFAGYPGLISEPFDPAALTELRETEMELEAQPDFEQWGNTGE